MNITILRRWVWKNTLAPAISPFVIFFLLSAFMFGLFLSFGLIGFPYFLLFLLLAIGFYSVVSAWTDYPENVIYADRFKVVLGDDAMTIAQPVLWRERWYATHFRGSLMLFFSHIGEIVAEPTATIAYNNVGSVFVKRSIWDRLFGIHKIVITLKDQQYSTFDPPITESLGKDFLGDSAAVPRLRGRIIVIPGLSKETARIAQGKMGKLSGTDGRSRLPKAFSWLSVLVAVIAVLIAIILIIFIFNAKLYLFNIFRLMARTS